MNKANSEQHNGETFLTVQDVMRLTGVTRRNLDRYEEAGIVSPFREANSPNAKRLFTFEQAKLVERVSTLQHATISLSEIGRLSAGSNSAFGQRVYRQSLEDSRKARRELKDAVSHEGLLRDIQAVGRCDELYLRYIPKRWFALVPNRFEEPVLPGSPRYMEQALDLQAVAKTVGWCTSGDTGIFASISAGEQRGSDFICCGLACAPMPEGYSNPQPDSGCYRAYAPEHYPQCDDTKCIECALFGREPSQPELDYWMQTERDFPALLELPANLGEGHRPYPTGTWSGAYEGWTVKPRLMPTSIHLPLGVRACEMPAQIYLCTQTSLQGKEKALKRFVELLGTLKTKPLTLENELACAAAAAQVEQQEAPTLPLVEPSAKNQHMGNPAMAGWNHVLWKREYEQLILPTNMALAPESGYCLTFTTIPSKNGDFTPRFEIAVPINASAVIPNLPAELR